MEANAGESFQMQILFNIFPRISLHCKLVPVQYREYEYGLFAKGHNAETPFECHARITKIILKYSRKYRYYRWRK